jgi:hypothetical protein
MDSFEEAMNHISSFIQTIVEEPFKSMSGNDMIEGIPYISVTGYMFYKLNNILYYVKSDDRINMLPLYYSFSSRVTTKEALLNELELLSTSYSASSLETSKYYNLIKNSLNI